MSEEFVLSVPRDAVEGCFENESFDLSWETGEHKERLVWLARYLYGELEEVREELEHVADCGEEPVCRGCYGDTRECVYCGGPV